MVTAIVIMAMTMMSVGVRGGEKCFSRASNRSPMKLSRGPGNRGRIHPARPRRIKMAPIITAMFSNKSPLIPPYFLTSSTST